MLPRLKIPSFKIKSSTGRGFTLIELLVVMMIISILALVGYSSYRTIQSKARDQRRKDDLKKIAVALELYYEKYGRYPCSVGDGAGGNPITPMVSSGPLSFMDVASYNTPQGNQPFWLKDAGCNGSYLTPVGATWVGLQTGPPGSVGINPFYIDKIKPFNTAFISDMPHDPLKDSQPYMLWNNPNQYGYSYHSSLNNGGMGSDPGQAAPNTNAGEIYSVWARLENANDPESCKNKKYHFCGNWSPCDNPADPNYAAASSLYLVIKCK